MAGPFLTRHLYVQWGGSLPGQEQWSCGIRIAPMGPGDVTNIGADSLAGRLEAGIGPAIVGFHTRAGSNINAAAKLQFVKANLIAADGHYEELSTNAKFYANIPGTDASAPPPNQVALAVTLRADVSRGPASKGRFYMPLPAVGQQVDATSGLLPVAFCKAIETSATLLVTELNAAVATTVPGGTPTNWKVAVMSRRAAGPATREMVNVVVGRVVDTQRRRRRSLNENYVD